jgi:NitT/TauT family transport system substrate-binding protein
LLAIAGAAALVVTACGSSEEASSGAPGSASAEAITVGIVPVVDSAPIYLGQKEGFFTDHGIDLTLHSGQGGAAIVPGVVSGEFRFGFGNMTSVLVAAEQGLPLQVVAGGTASTGDPAPTSAPSSPDPTAGSRRPRTSPANGSPSTR